VRRWRSVEKQREKEWWEGDRREMEDGEKRGGRERLEDDVRERDEAQRDGHRWEGEGYEGELRGEDEGAKQEREEHEKQGERWGEGKERWRCIASKHRMLDPKRPIVRFYYTEQNLARL